MPPPLLVLSIAFIAGLLLPEQRLLTWHALALIGLACFIFGLFERRLSRRVPLLAAWRTLAPLPVGVILAALLAGNALAMASQPALTERDVAWYNERGEVRLIGVIARPPLRYDTVQRFYLRVERITPLYAGRSERNYPVQGLVLVVSPARQRLNYGDRVRITGRLETPGDDSDTSYRDYLASKRVFSTMRLYTQVPVIGRSQGSPILANIYSLRAHAYTALVRSIPQPEASLLAGILLGIETDMPAAVKRAFQETGTSHIIAISGFNIAILSTVFMGIFLRFTPRLLAPFLAIFAIAAYTVLVGAQASVVRAAVMGSIGLVGHAIGRRQAGANALVFTAAVMCAFNPAILLDAGFLLSFTATLGLILYADPLKGWFVRLAGRVMSPERAERFSGPVGEYFFVYHGCPGDHAAGDPVSLWAAVAQLSGCQPADSAGTAAGDGAGRDRRDCRDDPAGAGRPAGAPGHAAAGIYHPDRRVAGASGVEFHLRRGDQPGVVRRLLPDVVQPDDLAGAAGGVDGAAEPGWNARLGWAYLALAGAAGRIGIGGGFHLAYGAGCAGWTPAPGGAAVR